MVKKLLRNFIIVFFILASLKSWAQGNDFQCTPTDLGFLTFASPPCSSGTGFSYGSPVTQSGTTIGATNDSLSGFIMSCYSGAPLHDLWYTFRATETHVEIQITGAGGSPLEDSYVGIYEALTNECVGLMPRGCSIGSGTGAHTMEFGPLTLGVQYYLQIASGTGLPSGDGGFTMVIRSKTICSDCSKNSVLQAYPLPVNAAYPPDTTVGFCYSVVGYNELYGNGFHGVVPLLGSGWDATTLTPISAADSADFAGQWKWLTGVNVGGTTGIVNGFFYDIGGDNNPTNNLGDHGTFSTIWTFCFTVKTNKASLCAAGLNDLSIRFLNFADGESGSLVTTYDCSGDEDYVFDAHMECCPKPYAVVPLAAGCNTTADGSILVYAGFSVFGYTYTLYNSVGAVVGTHIEPALSTSAYTFAGLLPGNYYLYYTENVAGTCQVAVNTMVLGPIEYNLQQTVFGCSGSTSCLNSASVILTNGVVSNVQWSNGEVGFVADSLCTGWNYVNIEVASSACIITDSIFINNRPFASPDFAYNLTDYCTADSFAVLSDYPATGGGTFSIVGPTPSGITSSSINSSTGTINLLTATGAGQIIIKYSSDPPCVQFYIDTINLEVSPPSPLASMYPNQTLCVGMSANSYLNSSLYDVAWHDATGYLTTQTIGSTYNFFGAAPFTAPGNYSFYLKNISATSTCKSTPLNVDVNVYPIPNVDAGPPLTACPGFGINLNCINANSFVWSPAGVLNNPNLVNPVATISSTTLFTVVGTDATSGCSASDTVTVFVNENGACDIVFYNGFTPNGDNSNDYWYIDGISADPKNEVTIFNRWGDRIWRTVGYDNVANRWEGKSSGGKNLLPDGTYFFIVTFKGTTYKGYVELTK